MIAMVGYALVAIWTAWEPRAISNPVRICGNLVAALSGSTATIALAMLTSRTAATRILRALGRASLQIFVSHTIFMATTRIVLLKVMKVDSPATPIVLGILGGVLPPLLLAHLAVRWWFPSLSRRPLRRSMATAKP